MLVLELRLGSSSLAESPAFATLPPLLQAVCRDVDPLGDLPDRVAVLQNLADTILGRHLQDRLFLTNLISSMETLNNCREALEM